MFYFHNFTTAARVKIHIPVDVATFGGISLVASSLNQVESQRKNSELSQAKFNFQRNRGYRLISFEVRSPPNISVLADPSWLAVFIGLLTLGVSCIQLLGSYSSVKGGAKELASDLRNLKDSTQEELNRAVSALSELTQAQKNDLLIGVNLYLDNMTRSIGEAEAMLLRAARFASILGRHSARPSLDVSAPSTTNTTSSKS
ncbi:MAG: hypothetical protein ACLPV8_01770 [Steroidobacteraceae bacterium]